MKKRNKYIAQDRIAMRIAAHYGMTKEYKTARRHRLTPLQALEDWDLLLPEERALFEDREPWNYTYFAICSLIQRFSKNVTK